MSPLYQQSFDWFREKYGLVGLICIGNQEYSYEIWDEKKGNSGEMISKHNLNGNYGESKINCLEELIKIIKDS